MAEVAEEIKKLGVELNAGIEKANNEAKEAGKVSVETKAAVEAITKQMTEAVGKVEAQQKHLDELDIRLKKGMQQGMSAPQSFKSIIEKELGDGTSLRAFKAAGFKGGPAIDFEGKAVGNLTSAGSLTGSYFVPAMMTPGVIMGTEFNPNHVRQYLASGTTTSNTIRYMVDNGGEGGPAMVAEGGTKPQTDRDLEIKDAPVRKIAHHMRVPEEMIADIPYLASHLTNVGLEMLATVEDTQILYGSGTGQNLTGLTVAASTFAAGALVVGATANVYDVLVAARLQIRKRQYAATAVFISPLDYAKLSLLKSSTGEYLFPETRNSGIPRIAGVPIVENTAITEGDFLIGDFQRGAMLVDRQQSRVQFFDQDRDNAILNLVTIVIEERLALPIYRPQAFVYGTFSTAITDLAS